MRFTGIQEAKLDAKGRVFFPSDFRRLLQADEARLVLKRDVFQPCLVLYPYAAWLAEVDEVKSRLNRWDPVQAMLFRQFMAEVEILNLDAAGRLLLSKRWLAAAELSGKVRFVGADDRVELWSAERADQCFMQPEAYAQAMQQAMNSGAPQEASRNCDTAHP